MASPQTDACKGFKISYTIDNPIPNQRIGQVFWGQAIRASLSPATSFSVPRWSVSAPAIADFNELIADNLTIRREDEGWKVVALTDYAMLKDHIRFYFVPQPTMSKQSPIVKVEASRGNFKCFAALQLSLTHYRRPSEIYSSDHKHRAQINPPEQGRVIDSHFVWHTLHSFDPSPHAYPSFLHWHHLFVSRFIEWRALFGYSALVEWNPNDSINPKKDLYLHTSSNRLKTESIPWTLSPQDQVKDFSVLEENVIEAHNGLHLRIQHCEPNEFGCFMGASSPMSELFWRFHLFLDNKFFVLQCLGGDLKLDKCPQSDSSLLH